MNCRKAESLLSEYIDNALSARETWEVEKHLGLCNACTRLLNETRRTVNLLADAPRSEVSTDFVANLQARIANIEQEPARRAWVESLRELFRPRVRPVWGAAMAACGLVAVFVIQNISVHTPDPIAPNAATPLVQAARMQSIALAATDPFGDTAAASVAASAGSSSQPASEPPANDPTF